MRPSCGPPLLSTARSTITPSERTSVHSGSPSMYGRQWIGSGSVSPIASTCETMIAWSDQVTPLSVERITAALKPRVLLLFWWDLIRRNPSTRSPLSGSATIWFEIVWFCSPGSYIGWAVSQVGLAAAPFVVRENQVGPRNANLLCSNADAAALELGATIRSHTA